MRLSGLNRGYQPLEAGVSETTTPDSLVRERKPSLKIDLRSFAMSAAVSLSLSSLLVSSVEAKTKYPIKGGAASVPGPQPSGRFDARQEINRIKLMASDPRVVSIDEIRSDDDILYNAQLKCEEPLKDLNVRLQRYRSHLVADIGATAVVSRGTSVWFGQANIPGYDGPVSVGEPFEAQCPSIVDIKQRIAIYRAKKRKDNKPPQKVSYMTRLSEKSILPAFPQVNDPSIKVVQNDAATFTNMPKTSRQYDYWLVLDREVTPGYSVNVPSNMPTIGGRTKLGFRLGRKANYNVTKSRPDTIFVK